ncbi:MAG TPA: malate synthase A [Pirellulales bacterium]|jgi:malate synthase
MSPATLVRPRLSAAQITGPLIPAGEEILTPGALEFLARLQRSFNPRRRELLARRQQVQARIDAGQLPDFLPQTRGIRDSDWRVVDIPADLLDRRVEITGPVDRKMVINALNSGAKMYMADFEDSHAPTWEATLQGQVNLRDAVRGTIELISSEGKEYRLNRQTATLLVRPRGWHLVEKHVQVDGQPVSASLFDFAMFAYHNATHLVERGTGPYFYLPKLENHLEARLWNEVFVAAEGELGLARSTMRATVLIETILAAFEMDEILWELREHCVGLNCGRWDYIFSFIKKFRGRPSCVLPDRALVTMTTHFLRSYSQLLIKTCHRRGALAMGGMAAQIPIKNNPEADTAAVEKVRQDKLREVADGHDGTWVAHPGQVSVAMQVFDQHMPTANQLHISREDVQVTAADLLRVPMGSITEAGLRTNVLVGLLYLASWLRGNGCVPIDYLMEDAATAEICRAQMWQWIRHPQGVLTDGRRVTVEVFRQLLAEELDKIRGSVGEQAFVPGKFALAAQLMDRIVSSDEFVEFLTLLAYEFLK